MYGMGVALILQRDHINATLVPYWHRFTDALVRYRYCVGPTSVLVWYCLEVVLGLHWHCVGIQWFCTGVVLVLHWYCNSIVLALREYYACTALALYVYFTSTTLARDWWRIRTVVVLLWCNDGITLALLRNYIDHTLVRHCRRTRTVLALYRHCIGATAPGVAPLPGYASSILSWSPPGLTPRRFPSPKARPNRPRIFPMYPPGLDAESIPMAHPPGRRSRTAARGVHARVQARVRAPARCRGVPLRCGQRRRP